MEMKHARTFEFCFHFTYVEKQRSKKHVPWKAPFIQRFRTIAVFPINWERLDAGVFTPILGVVHNCHHFHERTQRTHFCDPLPPPKSVL